MKKRCRLAGILSAAFLSLSMLTACSGFSGGTGTVFEAGETSCSAAEARLYLVNAENQYRDYFGTDLLNPDVSSDASVHIRDVSTELKKQIEDSTLQRLENIYAMDLLAEEKNIALTEDETERIGQAASEYFGSLSDAEQKALHVTEEDIVSYYTHYALAQKTYEKITASGNAEVSQDAARVMQVQVIQTTDAGIGQAVLPDASGDVLSFEQIAEQYDPGDGTAVKSIRRGDLPAEVETAVFALSDDQTSGVLQSQDAYYLVHCVKSMDEEQTEENRQKLQQEQNEDNFEAVYEPFLGSVQFQVNEGSWNRLKQEDMSDLTTKSFFTTFDQYMTESQ